MSRGSVALCVLLTACAAPMPPARPASHAPDDDAPSAARAGPRELEPESSAPGWLGVEVSVPLDAEGGVLVRSILRGSPAERAGLEAGDRILKLDGAPVLGPQDVERLVSARAPGSRVPVVVRRGASQRLLAAELGAVPDDSGLMRMSFVGAQAPAWLSLDAVQGSVEPDLNALRGRVVVLEFWAPWCAACRLLVPRLNAWFDRFSAQGVVVVGVTTDAVVSASHAAQQLGIRYPVASDHGGKTTRAYRASAVPALFVIDKRGVVRDALVGYSADGLDEIERLVERLTDER